MLTQETKARVKIIVDPVFAESYNSAFRAIITKPVNEKYARKLIQDTLKDLSIYGATVNTLYENPNGIKSQQEDKWVFGLTLPSYCYITGSKLEQLSEVGSDIKI